jgi:hypothetical protein
LEHDCNGGVLELRAWIKVLHASQLKVIFNLVFCIQNKLNNASKVIFPLSGKHIGHFMDLLILHIMAYVLALTVLPK